MSQLSIIDRARVMRLAIAQAQRKSLANVLGSPLLRWRYGAPIADALAMVPQELRTADPSFMDEIEQGQFGLASTSADIGQGTPFDITPPHEAWARELHGFSWLRHLNAAASDEATGKARSLVQEWIGYGEARHDVAWEPDVTGRRIVSWLCSASMLLDGIDQATFDRTSRSLVDQLIALSAAWDSAPDGYPRLEALIGVVYGDVCILGHERHLAVSEAKLASELTRQILPDGGHVSRNAGVLLQLMLDLLPLRQCFATRKRALPPAIDTAMTRMSGMLRFMRLGDSTLAHFNGVGVTPVAELSTVLAYDTTSSEPGPEAPQSRYFRLARGGTLLVMDAGEAPSLELAGQAHAGALSFEMSAGACVVVVNAGAPGRADQQHAAAARATASHSTLTLADKSTGRLMQDDRLERLIGGKPLRSLGSVTAVLEPSADGLAVAASHTGYLGEHQLVHSRRIAVTEDGRRITGTDRLAGEHDKLRLARDLPFAIRFHLHAQVDCEAAPDGAIILEVAEGIRLRFSAEGAEPSIEPSLIYADSAGAVRTRQIVLRGACWGDSEVRWKFDRLE